MPDDLHHPGEDVPDPSPPDLPVVAADFSLDGVRGYYVVVLRDDQVDRIAERVVELLRVEEEIGADD